MMKRSFPLVAIAALTLSACSKSEAGAAPSGSASAGSAPAATPASGCAAGAYVHPDPKFCVELPPKLKAKPPKAIAADLTRVSFETDEFGPPFSVDIDKRLTFDEAKRMVEAPSTNQDDQKTHGTSGNTAWMHLVFKGGIEQFELFVPSKAGLLKCYVNASKAEAPPLIAACKTLKVIE